jgi:hypothetical protein
MGTIYQKIKAKAVAKKMDKDIIAAASGNEAQSASDVVASVGAALYKPTVAKDKGHEGDENPGHPHTEVFENSTDGTSMGSTSVTTTPEVKGKQRMSWQQAWDADMDGIRTGGGYGGKFENYLKDMQTQRGTTDESKKKFDDVVTEKTGLKKIGKVDGVKEKKEATFTPYTQNNPGTNETTTTTTKTEEKPMLYNNDRYSVRTNQAGIDIADRKQLKKLKKLEKKRDGKGFLGFKKKSELEDSAYNRAVDAQIKSVEAGGVPDEARNNIFKTGLFNRGTGGKSQPGTPGSETTTTTNKSTEGSSGLVDWNEGTETSGTYDPATGSFTVNNTGASDPKVEKKASENMDDSTANYKPSLIGNNKSFKMKGMNFKS